MFLSHTSRITSTTAIFPACTWFTLTFCYCHRQPNAKHDWTHLTKSILLFMAAQWRSVTFSLSGCRTSKPASTNSLQRSKMPYLRERERDRRGIKVSSHTKTPANTDKHKVKYIKPRQTDKIHVQKNWQLQTDTDTQTQTRHPHCGRAWRWLSLSGYFEPQIKTK